MHVKLQKVFLGTLQGVVSNGMGRERPRRRISLEDWYGEDHTRGKLSEPLPLSSSCMEAMLWHCIEYTDTIENV